VASTPIPIAAAAASAAGHSKKEHRSNKAVRKEKVIKLGPDGSWKLLQMTEEHVDEVIRIQQACYEPEYREERQSYVNRIRIFPEGNVVLMVPDPTATPESPSTPPSPSSPPSSKKRKSSLTYTMAGYILAQPFYRGAINDVNDVMALSKWIEDRENLPRTEGDCIYIHEISIDPDFRGQGLTLPLTQYAETLARGANFKWLTLVALGSALGFWNRTGYVLEQEIVYGGHTCFYMEKPSGLDAAVSLG